jgi:hypothetical protein
MSIPAAAAAAAAREGPFWRPLPLPLPAEAEAVLPILICSGRNTKGKS